MYTRYGASRIYVSESLGLGTIPAVLCLFRGESGAPAPIPDGFLAYRSVNTPEEVLTAFGPPSIVGNFEVSNERIDAHRMEP